MADQDLTRHRFAPPRSHVEDVEAPPTGPAGMALASRNQRFWAAMIDLGTIIAAMWLATSLTPWQPWGDAVARSSLWQPVVRDTLLGFGLFVLLQGYLLARRSQTIGKALLGLRIARPDGSAPSFGRLLGLRYGIGYAMAIVPAIGQVYAVVDVLLIFRASRRCLHDVIADTVVLKG